MENKFKTNRRCYTNWIKNILMKFKKIKYLALILLTSVCLTLNSFSQQNIIDSLHNVLNKTNKISDKASIYNQISYEIFQYYKDSGFYYANKAIEIAIKTNDKKNYSEALYNIGLTYHEFQNYDSARFFYHKALKIDSEENESFALICTSMSQSFKMNSRFDSSLFYANKALDIYQKSDNKNKIGRIYLLIGVIYRSMGIYDKATDYQMKALKIKEEIGDKLGQAQCLGNLATICYDQGDLDKTLDFTKKCIKLFEELNNEEGLATSYSLLAGILMAKNLPEEAIKYFNKTLITYEKINFPTGIASVYGNLAIIYESLNDFIKAKESFNKAIEVSHNAEDLLSETIAYINLASFYNKTKEYSLSIETAKKALKIAENINALDEQRLANDVLSKAYFNTNDFKNAYLALDQTMLFKDSIYNNEKLKQINQLQIEYETENKENEIKLLNKENQLNEIKVFAKDKELRSHRLFILIIVFGIIVLAIFLFVVFRLYRQKIRNNSILEVKNIEINQQKETLQIQSEKLSVTVKDLQIKNSKITERINYAKTIQTAIMPSEIFFKENFKDYFVFFRPKDIVSGDFYWSSEIDNNIFVAVGDCTGHGVPGAFMSMIGNTLLNQIVNEKKIINPAQILNELNQGIVFSLEQHGDSDFSGDDGMDITICLINKNQKEITIAAANHESLLIIDGKSELFEGSFFAIGKEFGKSIEKEFQNQSFKYNDSAKIYLFSDGYYDQFGGPQNKRFNKSQIVRLLNENSNLSFSEQCLKINEAFESWKGNKKQTDDILILGLNI